MNTKQKQLLKQMLTLLAQIIVIVIVGVVTKDIWYSIAISVLGISFNFLVAINNPIGFIFGTLYAITQGIMAYYTAIYATFGFMICIQAPMAIYTFIAWHKKKKASASIMKPMPIKVAAITLALMAVGTVAVFFILKALKSKSIIVDLIFFMFSICACILLALRYKNAYFLTLFSGLGGTALWIYQAITTKQGITLAVFYAIASLNSVVAVYQQYRKPALATAKNDISATIENDENNISTTIENDISTDEEKM